MRRPINWVVFCLSLLFLYANLSFGSKPFPTAEHAPVVASTRLDFSHVVLGDGPTPEFGYVRDDGSFVPLADESVRLTRRPDETTALISASTSWQ